MKGKAPEKVVKEEEKKKKKKQQPEKERNCDFHGTLK